LLSTDFGPVCDFWQSSSSTWQVLDPTGQLEPGPGGPKGAWRAPQKNLSSRLEACCVWWTVFNLPISASLSPLFTQAKFFLRGPLRTPGPRGTCPGYPPPSRWACMRRYGTHIPPHIMATMSAFTTRLCLESTQLHWCQNFNLKGSRIQIRLQD